MNNPNRKHIVFFLLLPILPFLFYFLASDGFGDYNSHQKNVNLILAGSFYDALRHIQFVGYLLAALIYKTADLLGAAITPLHALFYSVSFFLQLKFFSIYYVFNKNIESIHSSTKALLALACCVAGPFFLPYITSFYRVNSTLNSWHNSTIIFVTFIAVLSFHFFVTFFDSKKTGHLIISVLLTFASFFFKPSFFISFMPVIAGGYLIYLIMEHKISRKFFFIVISAFFLFCLMIYFTSISYNMNIGIKPFFIIDQKNYKDLPLVFVYVPAIVFPVFMLVVSLFYRKSANRRALVIALMFHAVAVVQYSLFFESNNRLMHGNFGWARQTSGLIFFVYATIFWVNNRNMLSSKINYIAAFIFSTQVFTGVCYLILMIVGKKFIL